MAEKTFESQMERLEEIVRLLEKGEAPLGDSIKLFRAEGDSPAGKHAR